MTSVHASNSTSTSQTRPTRVVRWWGRRRVYLIPLVIVLIVGLPQLPGGRVRVDTGLYTGLSLNAFDHGHFWTLMAGDVPYFRKPPLPFWIHGAMFQILGRELWVVKLTVLISAAVCALMAVAIARKLAGPRAALFTGIIFILYDGFLRYIKRFILDYWHTFFILAAVYLVIVAAKRNKPWMIVLGGTMLGFALLCKPLSALIALPILGVWLICIGKPKFLWWLIPSALAAVAVAAPWHISMTAIHGEQFTNEYFGKQVIDRGTGDDFDPEPWHSYITMLAGHYWPWLLTLIAGIVTWIRSDHARRRDWWSVLLVIIWCGAWLVLASCFADKRDRYIFHVMPILALPSAIWLARWSPKSWRKARKWWLDGLCGIGLLVSIGLTISPIEFDDPDEAEWVATYQFVRDHPDDIFYIGSIKYTDGGRIYMYTGVWPNNRIDANGKIVEPPPGAIVLYLKDHKPVPDAEDEILFDQGIIQIARVR